MARSTAPSPRRPHPRGGPCPRCAWRPSGVSLVLFRGEGAARSSKPAAPWFSIMCQAAHRAHLEGGTPGSPQTLSDHGWKRPYC